MGQLAENNTYLKIDSTEINSYFKNVNLQPGNSAVDTTMGAGVDHVQRKPGLNDHTISMSIGYDDTNVATYLQKLKVGVIVTIEYGPEGAVSGKPRHVQNFIITGAPSPHDVQKGSVAFDVTASAADAPSVDMFAGGVYS